MPDLRMKPETADSRMPSLPRHCRLVSYGCSHAQHNRRPRHQNTVRREATLMSYTSLKTRASGCVSRALQRTPVKNVRAQMNRLHRCHGTAGGRNLLLPCHPRCSRLVSLGCCFVSVAATAYKSIFSLFLFRCDVPRTS